MKIALGVNPLAPAAIAIGRTVVAALRSRADLVLSEDTDRALGGPGLPTRPIEALDAEVLVSVGGDGSFLWSLLRTSMPLLPINAGTVGFLAEVDGRDAAAVGEALDRLVGGRYVVEGRMKLACEGPDGALPDATNEIVVHTSQVAKMRLFEIGVDGHPVGRIRADGILLATPTGSTSYSLSALGPIVEPTLEAIVVTALAPFQTTQRAVVVDPLRTVSVRLVRPEKDGVVVIDGQSETRIPGGTTLRAYRSPRRASFVRFGLGFYEQLRGKRILPWSEEAPPDPSDGADLPPPA
ncbi:MAG TPA: NAD(+)/NADH kinase [Thermoplasmata archaeon]|nr:NAD(+)/NADH kinase [Thermoplasmata archaeon]